MILSPFAGTPTTSLPPGTTTDPDSTTSDFNVTFSTVSPTSDVSSKCHAQVKFYCRFSREITVKDRKYGSHTTIILILNIVMFVRSLYKGFILVGVVVVVVLHAERHLQKF